MLDFLRLLVLFPVLFALPTPAMEQVDSEDEIAEDMDDKGPISKFHRDFIYLMAKVISADARIANLDPIAYVCREMAGENAPQQAPVAQVQNPVDYGQEVTKTMTNFDRFFTQGAQINEKLEVDLLPLNPGELRYDYPLTSPVDLARANLAINNMMEESILTDNTHNPIYAYFCQTVHPLDFQDTKPGAEKIIKALCQNGLIDQANKLIDTEMSDEAKIVALMGQLKCSNDVAQRILEILHCVQVRSRSDMIRLRLTKSSFLDPRVLSEMSGGQLSAHDAHLLLTCVGLSSNNKKLPVCNLATSEYSQDIVNFLRGKTSPKLCFICPTTRVLKGFPKIDLSQCGETQIKLERATKYLAGIAFHKLEELLPELFKEKGLFSNAIIEAGADHLRLRKLFFDRQELEQLFYENAKHDGVAGCFAEIREWLLPRLTKLDEIAGQLPTEKNLMEHFQTLEAETRLKKAVAAKGHLEESFNRFKHILRPFLLFTTQQFVIQNPYAFQVFWHLGDINVREDLTLEKSCALLRRLHFPVTEENERTDLTYFADQPNDCILHRWNKIRDRLGSTDAILAGHFLDMYKTCHLTQNADLNKFLVPLMILIMGKEPSLDRSSISTNFILLLSVKLGVCSFAQALGTMPMIPQGAVSAKQFLLHVNSHSLDALSGVQYKKSNTILHSYFLPTLMRFIGTADDWTQKYDDVVSVAVECCSQLFLGNIDPHDPRIQDFHRKLERLTGQSLKLTEIPRAITCIAEVGWERNRAGIHILNLNKRNFANRFLISMGQLDDPSTAVARCQKYFSQGVDPNNPAFGQLKVILDRIYPEPVPYEDFAEAIDYRVGLDDGDDEIGAWAINYLFALHPLSALLL